MVFVSQFGKVKRIGTEFGEFGEPWRTIKDLLNWWRHLSDVEKALGFIIFPLWNEVFFMIPSKAV